MDQFDILTALESAAITKGWKFVFGLSLNAINYAVQQPYANEELVLIADCKIRPNTIGVKYASITYTCALWLGRKFDSNGQPAALNETDFQKYQRRLKDLAKILADFIANFKCDNELGVNTYDMTYSINEFNANLDFVLSNNVIFTQE